MITRRMLRIRAARNWVVPFLPSDSVSPFKIPSCECLHRNPRSYGSKGEGTDRVRTRGRTPVRRLKLVQAAFFDYLHCTRNLPYVDAENISKNSPEFVMKLLGSVVGDGEDAGRSAARFLRYHPINEFEPFYESIGLSRSDYAPLLSSSRLFLIEDGALLENYRVLCNYGIDHCKIGLVYKRCKQIFEWDHGVLSSKIAAYEKLGISQSAMVKFIVSSPYVLVGDICKDFVEALDELKSTGFRVEWIEEHILDESEVRWDRVLSLLCFFRRMGYSEQELQKLISHHLDMLFDDSGSVAYSLIGFMLKLGSSMSDIFTMLLQLPSTRIREFLSNLRRCYLFVAEIGMEAEDVNDLLRSYPLLLGSCCLNRPNTILTYLNLGKKKLCKIIKDDPSIMQHWTKGSLIERNKTRRTPSQKINFLMKWGIVRDATDSEQALKVYRGKGEDLQERFNCIVEAGIDQMDVVKMIRLCPKILNQSKGLIEKKIQFLVTDLGYPLSTLVNFPAFLGYNMQRVRLRCLMYSWLKGEGVVDPLLALSTVVASSDSRFVDYYVSRHPSGPEMWRKLKENILMV
ncbi:hypothetical protein MLD38_035638 [Melastoma candidum]|uniref:Uncharacterized protein n=1 Tax=Melastoma candidum TaxID=119954 RepID=A0ACB9LHR0_9MYRT|nr:hypothetical protein MLD38_035638 [Melastoma candidum]